MMWPGRANSGKFEALHSFLSFDKDFQIKQMLNFTFSTLIFLLKYQSKLCTFCEEVENESWFILVLLPAHLSRIVGRRSNAPEVHFESNCLVVFAFCRPEVKDFFSCFYLMLWPYAMIVVHSFWLGMLTSMGMLKWS